MLPLSFVVRSVERIAISSMSANSSMRWTSSEMSTMSDCVMIWLRQLGQRRKECRPGMPTQ